MRIYVMVVLELNTLFPPILGGLLSEELRSLSSVVYIFSLPFGLEYFTPDN